jgi:SAM-dependent methyltransferase
MRDFNQDIRFSYITVSLKKILTKPAQHHLKVLDVGAGSGVLADYLTRNFNCSITNIETSASSEMKNLVVADGRYLPFTDNSFDFAVSSDVFEHIDKKGRQTFLRETLRCSRQGIVFTFSKLHTKNPDNAGIKMFEFFSKPFPQWYREHNSCALVDDQKLYSAIKGNGGYVVEVEPFSGVIAVFFTGLILRVHHLQAFINLLVYPFIKLFDTSPYYGFGVVALKANQEKRS